MQAADQAAPYVRKGVDTVGPIVKTAAGYAKQVAEPIISAATPIVQARLNFPCGGPKFGLLS